MRTVLVTGSEGYIGRALVEKFLSTGKDFVVSVDIVRPARELTANEIFIHADLSSADSIRELWHTLAESKRNVDVLINNAALGGQRQPLHEYDTPGLDAIMAINVRAPFLMTQHAVGQALAGGKECSILNMASTAAFKSAPEAAPYCISKAALVATTKATALEYSSKGIRCNSISPGPTEKFSIQGFNAEEVRRVAEGMPQGRLGTASEVADIAFFLASLEARHITGQDITVDGGFLLV